MISRVKLNSALRVFTGVVFIVSAILKLISIDSFEIYVYSFGVLKLDLAFLFSRFLISFELFAGILLITGMYPGWIIPVSVTVLSLFSIFIIYLLVTSNSEHCHCFGDIEISNPTSLLKNILLIGFLSVSYKGSGHRYKYERYLVVFVSVMSITIPMIISPPDTFLYKKYSKSVTYNDQKLSEFLKDNRQYASGKKMLCFFSPGCRFCKMAVKKVLVIASKTNHSDIVNIVFTGTQVSVDKFFNETKSDVFQYSFLPANSFLRITNGEMPLIILLEDGVVKGKYGYRDINENEFVEFMRN